MKTPKSEKEIRGPIRKPQREALTGTLPTTVDWVAEGVTTPVKVSFCHLYPQKNVIISLLLNLLESRSVWILLGSFGSRGGRVAVDYEWSEHVGVLRAAGHQLHHLLSRLRGRRHRLWYVERLNAFHLSIHHLQNRKGLCKNYLLYHSLYVQATSTSWVCLPTRAWAPLPGLPMCSPCTRAALSCAALTLAPTWTSRLSKLRR